MALGFEPTTFWLCLPAWKVAKCLDAFLFWSFARLDFERVNFKQVLVFKGCKDQRVMEQLSFRSETNRKKSLIFSPPPWNSIDLVQRKYVFKSLPSNHYGYFSTKQLINHAAQYLEFCTVTVLHSCTVIPSHSCVTSLLHLYNAHSSTVLRFRAGLLYCCNSALFYDCTAALLLYCTQPWHPLTENGQTKIQWNTSISGGCFRLT